MENSEKSIYIAYISLSLSGYGIIRLLLHRIRSEEDLPLFHQPLFRAHAYLLYAAFYSSLSLLLLSCKSRGKRSMDQLRSFIMWVALNSGVYAMACALCIEMELGVVGRSLVLISAALSGVLALLVSPCADPKVFDEMQTSHVCGKLQPAAQV